ncbi:hypothetical protein [Methylobacterium oxalidis]|nr:hypothetical protein [Methylobacterium oxalidis]
MSSVLEVGPFLSPCLTRPRHDVSYFDVLNGEQMLERARHLTSIPYEREYWEERLKHPLEIDYFHPDGDLSSVPRTFANLFSSHCIEHQPDLITHMQQAYERIEPGGRYFMIVPDKRYCFDHYNPESRLIDVLGAHLERRRRACPTKVLEHRLATAHNDPVRHWMHDHGRPTLEERPEVFGYCLEEAATALETYIDVHYWMFTPDSFRRLMNELYEREFIKLRLERVYPTLRNTFEFFAVFRRGN